MIQELYKALERPKHSKYGEIVQKIILINILTNIVIIFLQLLFKLPSNITDILAVVEKITVAGFMIELVLRYISIGYNKKYSGLIGKIKFTFTFYTLIDIITILFYFIPTTQINTMLFRLMRFLKLARMKHLTQSCVSIKAFATSSIFVQIMILFVFSIFFISIFSLIYGTEKTSLMIFLDPPALAETKNDVELLFGIAELMLGLLIGGALISIITETLSNITSKIQDGYYPYNGKNHIVIVNQNHKLSFILKELNRYYTNIDEVQDIVIFIPFVDDIENFRENLNKYSNLNIIVLKGEAINWNSYKRFNINQAKNMIILEEHNATIESLNLKISRFILSHHKFNNDNLKFIIEIQDINISKNIYNKIFDQSSNQYQLIQHTTIMENFLNRSIINPLYFKIFLELVSFKGYEFYTIKSNRFFNTSISFKEAYNKLTSTILVGINKQNDILLNPPSLTMINIDDELIILATNPNDIEIKNSIKINNYDNIELSLPNLTEDKKICVLGDYSDIDTNNIIQFLTQSSIDNMDHIVQDDYFEDNLWENIKSKNYDSIILNLEDNLELLLTLYLQGKYKDDTKFINSIINIIHDPINAMLLDTKNDNNKVILSEKLVGKYITQIIFNTKIVDIFDEITQPRGNEFYLLTQEKYPKIFTMELEELKYHLFENQMIYIGIIQNDNFMANSMDVSSTDMIVVLTRGA